MLDEFIQRDIAENGEYRRVQELLRGNRQRYEQRGRYAKELARGLQATVERLRETVLAKYDQTFEAVELGAMDTAEQNAQNLLRSSSAVKALGADRVLDLQTVVEYARALQEPNKFIQELGKEYVVSAFKTLYEQASQLVKGTKKNETPVVPTEDPIEETWFAQGNDPKYFKDRN